MEYVSITYGNPGDCKHMDLCWWCDSGQSYYVIMTAPIILAVAFKLLLLLLAMTSTVNQLPILDHFLTSFITPIPCGMARSVLD